MPDPRNKDVLLYVNGDFVPRNRATVSVFDSGFISGDGVWEGLRLVNGKLFALDEHMDRLFEGARHIGLEIGMSRHDLVELIWSTLRNNSMRDGVHIRVMVTRGIRSTANKTRGLSLAIRPS